jgi:16S rRNA (guanine527-N7)-methyltransferase
MTLARDPFLAERNVSRETEDRLLAFADLLGKWTRKINLISKSSTSDIWERHILDSVQIYDLAPNTFSLWLDIGSGGGLPGVVVAALAAQFAPDARIAMIESDQRKAAFLRTALRELGLSGDVLADRIDAVPPMGADVLSARALAPLDQLLAFAENHLKPGGTAIFPKGKTAEQEIADASTNWLFQIEKHASMTDAEARILVIKDIKRV